jgi:L-lactate dehydrogenase complex protein LldG
MMILMNGNGQAEFIEDIRRALRVDGKRDRSDLFCRKSKSDDESALLLDRISSRTRVPKIELFEKMNEAAKPLNIDVMPVKTLADAGVGILKLACEKMPEWGDEKSVVLWNHPLISEMNIEGLLMEQNIGVFHPKGPDAGGKGREMFIKESAAAFIGVTSADWCVAETATIVLKAAPGRERSVSLLPSIHVAVIKLEQIIADFKELYALLDRDLGENSQALEGGMTFITGPSKTADIEATMVRGAHGPRELYIYVVTGT